MTDDPDLVAAVQIARQAFGMTHSRATAVVAALARAGWLHDPAEVAVLRAVADAAGAFVHGPPGPQAHARYGALQRALDAIR